MSITSLLLVGLSLIILRQFLSEALFKVTIIRDPIIQLLDRISVEVILYAQNVLILAMERVGNISKTTL